jgi:hypothetical protein
MNIQEKEQAYSPAATIGSLPPETIALLESCPEPGYGVHQWIWQIACALRACGISDREVLFELIEENCSDPDRKREIWDAIINSADEKLATRSYQPRWPERDYQLINEIVRAGIGAETLFRTSPFSLGAKKLSPEKILGWMFSEAEDVTDQKNDPLICAGPKTRWMRTRRLSQWDRPFRHLTFVVPNPMTKVQGTNLDGELSWRCLDNTGEREYLVIDCDIKKSKPNKPPSPWDPHIEAWSRDRISVDDANAAILWKLKEWLDLALVVYSGSVSFHGWFACRGVPENELFKFMRNAVLLGADRALWPRSQPVRMPEGIRWEDKDPPVRQRVCYFDPQTVEKWRGGQQ